MQTIQRTTYRFTKGIVNLPLILSDKDSSGIGKKIMIDVNGKLKPKVDLETRYLFWEVDNKEEFYLDSTLSVYEYLKLPVYYHESMKGYHFYSFTPIDKTVWKLAIKMLRPLNESYPPITLRVKANKYVNELEVFRKGKVIGNNAELETFKTWIERQHIGLINLRYYMITYPMDNNDITHEMDLQTREQAFQKQIEDSEVE